MPSFKYLKEVQHCFHSQKQCQDHLVQALHFTNGQTNVIKNPMIIYNILRSRLTSESKAIEENKMYLYKSEHKSSVKINY